MGKRKREGEGEKEGREEDNLERQNEGQQGLWEELVCLFF